MIKRTLWVWLLASGLQSSWAYSFSGPVPGYPGLPTPYSDAWEDPTIGYGGTKGPKNLGEEYRRNTPVMYWTADATFYDFFKTNGVNALRNAFAVLNALTNVDNYSPELTEFPLETRHINFQAQALGLIDLKSYTLGLMLEQMGLANPVQYTWTLHDRVHVNGAPACPLGMEYLVVQRNYDYISDPLNQLQYSPYVNNVLYSYTVEDFCAPPNPLALTVPFSVDPLASLFSPVASFQEDYPGVNIILMYWGGYYSGLTRDDVAGLRYLLSTNNINAESVVPGVTMLSTNLGSYTFITSSNLNSLLVASQTNAPDTIPTLFPGVTVTSATTNYTVLATPNVYSYYAIPPGSAYPAVPVLTTVTNGYTYTPIFVYQDTFAGILTNANLTNTLNVVLGNPNITLSYYTNTPASLVTVTIGIPVGSAYPAAVVTNTTAQPIILTNAASGEYISLPTGSNQCGWNIIAVVATNVVSSTNLIATATNNVTSGSLATNSVGFVGTVSVVTYFTNHIFLAQPINCLSSVPTNGLYEGVGRIQFVEADFDSYLGQFFQPITNNYTMTMVTNGQASVQRFQRVVTAPDFLFAAADLANGPGAAPSVNMFTRNLNFDVSHILRGLAGPGTITPATTVTFNKSGPVFFNDTDTTPNGTNGTPYFNEFAGSDLTDTYYSFYFVYANFDGTTNAPVVYPNGTTIQELQSQVLIQISPSTLPVGYSEVPYGPVRISTTGGSFTQPYTWSASGLPSGLKLDSNADSTATLYGTPDQSGASNFILTLTDTNGRTVRWAYTITIQ